MDEFAAGFKPDLSQEIDLSEILPWLKSQPEAAVVNIGSTFGSLPAALPTFELPHIPFERTAEMLPAALTIAFLGGVESLLSAVVADGMTGGRHRSNMELVAQGVANVGSALVALYVCMTTDGWAEIADACGAQEPDCSRAP